jgi:hypothetical protein
MANIVQFTLKLPKVFEEGKYKGKVVVLNGLTFKQREATVRGDAKEIAGVVRYFTRSYQAEVIPHGTSEVHPSTEQGEAESVPSGVRPDGTGSEEETAVHLGADDGARSGSPRSGADRDGHEDSRLSTQDRFNQSSSNQINPEKLMEVLKKLDPGNDGQWNAVGLPKLNVVGELYGNEGVTRKDIDSVWPEFNRKMATV